MQSMRNFRNATSGIAKLDQECCLTVQGKERSLDLQASSKLVRRDWLTALRFVCTLRALGALSRLEQRKHAELLPRRSEWSTPKTRAHL